MAYERGPTLSGARLEDLDLSSARLHAPNFEGAKITDAWFYNADISGDLEGLRLNGVEVAPLVMAELERRSPERAKLRAADPAGLADAWVMVEDLWQSTIARARKLPEPLLYERVDDEWSFVETLRHLVLATDCWLRRMVKGMDHPYHPWGLAGSWLTDPASWGMDPLRARPSKMSSSFDGTVWTRSDGRSALSRLRNSTGSVPRQLLQVTRTATTPFGRACT